MILDEIGITAEMMLEEVSKYFSHGMVAEHVVMPNHVHLILVLNDIRKFVGDGEMMDNGIRLDVGPCHGMALRATDDGTVGTRHGVSPPHGVSLVTGIITKGSLITRPEERKPAKKLVFFTYLQLWIVPMRLVIHKSFTAWL